MAVTGSSCVQTEPSGGNELQRVVVDDLERPVRLRVDVDRAVSLAPNLTEIVFAVGAGGRLVGVTSFCNYPPEAREIKVVSDTLTPNIESIIAAEPDVVLVSTASQLETFTKTLARRGVAVFVTNPDSIEGISESIKRIGVIFGKQGEALRVVNEIEERLEKVRLATQERKRVPVFVQIDKNALYTIGKDSYLTDLIEIAGGRSLTDTVATAYPKLSRETALALQPEAIILSDSPDNDAPNEVFANSPAVKNGRVFRIDADLLSRPGPRIADAAERIARALHDLPEE